MNIEIELDKDKEPYIKMISNDKVINLTGESGSGKSYFSNQWKDNDDYIIIDTDEVFSKVNSATGFNKEFGEYLRKKYSDNLPNLYDNFDVIYQEILDYFKNFGKIIVIDSAQFRNMKDLSKLKGKIIIMRTCINKCFERCIKRYNINHPNATEEEKQKYLEKKKKIYTWYKYLNSFILKVDNI